MKRIYPAHAYGPAPRAHCYWPATADAPDRPAAQGRLFCDVAVIGAGFTGLSAALHLAQAGADVIVLEAEGPGWGASGRNGGFCCLGGAAAGDTVLRRLYGDAARAEFRQTERAAIDTARTLIDRHGIACDVHSRGETLMAHTPRAFAGFERRARRIEADYGLAPEIIPAGDLAAQGMAGPFHGAMTTPAGFALNPLKYSLGLAQAAAAAGARIFGHSPVVRIDGQSGFMLHTPAAQVSARRLIVATNGYSSDDLPRWMRGRYLPTQSNVIVTRTLGADEIAAQGWSKRQMCYDDRFLLHYFRLMPNGRMLFGMRGGLGSSPASDAAMHRTIRAHFETMFPAWAHVDTPYSWHGLLSISCDLTPFAGPIPEMPGAFAALSYHGNGVAMASHAGAILADLARGAPVRPLYPAIMRRPPRRFPLGRFRRAHLLPLYAGAALSGG